MSGFVQKIFAMKCQSRRKPNKCKSFLVPVAARGCLPPRANVCIAAPNQSEQTVVQSVFFMISDIGDVNQLLGSPFFPLLSFSHPPSLLLPLSSLKSTKSGRALQASPAGSGTEPQPKLNLELKFKIRHLVATNLKIFLRIK